MVVAVGGDGTFLRACSKYPNTPVIAFKQAGSLGMLIDYDLKNSKKVLNKVLEGKYALRSEPLLVAEVKGKQYISAGDFYVERGIDHQATRYEVTINDKEKKIEINGIGNGFIVSTPLGASGYFSYIEKLSGKKPFSLPAGSFGFEHILPFYLSEFINGAKTKPRIRHLLGKNFEIRVKLTRDIDQYLFSSSFLGSYIRLQKNSVIRFFASDKFAEIIKAKI